REMRRAREGRARELSGGAGERVAVARGHPQARRFSHGRAPLKSGRASAAADERGAEETAAWVADYYTVRHARSGGGDDPCPPRRCHAGGETAAGWDSHGALPAPCEHVCSGIRR